MVTFAWPTGAWPDLPPHGERTAFLVICKACQHVWPAFWAPCDVRVLAANTTKGCPWCGAPGKGNIFMASRGAGDIARYLAWLEVEVQRVTAMLAQPSCADHSHQAGATPPDPSHEAVSP